MKHTAQIVYELSWEEAQEILQNLLDNRTLDLHPSTRDQRLLEAKSSEQELDAGEIDERMTQYFGTKCICWATVDGILVTTNAPLYTLTHTWDDDSGAGGEVLAASASKSELSKILLAEMTAFRDNNTDTEWDRDLTDLPEPDDTVPCFASFGWKHGYCENVHRWCIDEANLV